LNPALDAAVTRSAAVVRERLAGRSPRIALLLGSGWGGVIECLTQARALPYADLPAFPAVGVEGHAGTLWLGRLGSHEVLVLAGRQHAYESGDVAAMKGAILTLAALGIEVLLQTHAAGSLDLTMRPGEFMLVSDHLNLVQASPLVGETGVQRFVDMRDAYDPALRGSVRDAALRAGIALHEGIYAWVLGPQFETPAEIRMLQRLGAQAVGMSTVPETIFARHAGLRVVAVSMLTNMACGLSPQALSHAHTLAVAAAAQVPALRLVEAAVEAVVSGLETE
jgi:purine-nucleoside phosphorylase